MPVRVVILPARIAGFARDLRAKLPLARSSDRASTPRARHPVSVVIRPARVAGFARDLRA